MKKNKILIISQNFYPEIGSAGNRIKNIFQLLKHEGYEVTVLTTDPSYPNKNLYSDPKFWNDDSLNEINDVHRIKVRNKKYSFSILNRLLYYIEVAIKMLFFVLFDKNKYNIIFVTTPPIFIGFVGLFAKLRYNAKMILDVRDLWPESLKGVGVFNYKFIIMFFSLCETFLYKKASHIIVNSIGFIDYISNKSMIDRKKIKFMPNSARVGEVAIEKEESHSQFKVIYTGNIGLAQDVDFLKELSIKLNEQKVKLSIVGYGLKKSELIQFAKSNKLENVSFLSPTTRAECLRINTQHDIGLISLNNKEVFDTVLPGKLIDYMISGLPVVASVSGYSKQLIEKYGTGYVSETRDTDEMIKYILYLKNNPEIREQLKVECLKLINSHFLWEKNIQVLLNMLDVEQYRENTTSVKLKGIG